MKWLSSTLKVAFGAAVLLILGYLAYDLLAFQSRSWQIARLLATAHPLERAPPDTLRRLLLAEAGNRIDVLVARNLLVSLKVSPVTRSAGGWQLTYALWTSLVRLHLSEDEKVTLLCSLSFVGERAYGFQAGARSAFRRNLDELDTRDLALLVVYTRSHGRFRRPEYAARAIEARDALMDHLE